MDTLRNVIAEEGVDRCTCGSKYWENDKCIDCGTPVREAKIAYARECDTRIAAEWDKYWAIAIEMTPFSSAIIEARKQIKKNEFYRAEDIAAAEQRNRAPHSLDVYAKNIAWYQEKIAKAEDELAKRRPALRAALDSAQQLDKDLYEGWNRFFLVKHIHSNQHCSSFRPTTRITWLPDVSGLTEAEAVASHGEALCTICFPSAPTELTRERLDPSLCAGSNQPYDETKRSGRETSYYSPTGICSSCGKTVGLTSRGSIKIRKHKKES